VEKIYNQESYLSKIVKKDPLKKYFFFIYNIDYNPARIELLYPKIFKFTFTEGLENNEFILKRIKFCIKLILKNLNLINHKVYSSLSQASTTEKFFIALDQIIQLEDFSGTEVNDKIPINWYSLFMTSNISFLPEEYKKNDYMKLYLELLKEEEDELSILHDKSNLIITKYGLNQRCAEKLLEKIKKDLIKVKQVERYVKMDKFIKNAVINVCVRHNGKEESNNSNNGSRSSGFFENIMFWNKRKTINNESNRISNLSNEIDK
jgi:hypothetical protein